MRAQLDFTTSIFSFLLLTSLSFSIAKVIRDCPFGVRSRRIGWFCRAWRPLRDLLLVSAVGLPTLRVFWAPLWRSAGVVRTWIRRPPKLQTTRSCTEPPGTTRYGEVPVPRAFSRPHAGRWDVASFGLHVRSAGHQLRATVVLLDRISSRLTRSHHSSRPSIGVWCYVSSTKETPCSHNGRLASCEMKVMSYLPPMPLPRSSARAAIVGSSSSMDVHL